MKPQGNSRSWFRRWRLVWFRHVKLASGNTVAGDSSTYASAAILARREPYCPILDMILLEPESEMRAWE